MTATDSGKPLKALKLQNFIIFGLPLTHRETILQKSNSDPNMSHITNFMWNFKFYKKYFNNSL